MLLIYSPSCSVQISGNFQLFCKRFFFRLTVHLNRPMKLETNRVSLKDSALNYTACIKKYNNRRYIRL